MTNVSVSLNGVCHLGYGKLATLQLNVKRANDHRQPLEAIPHIADNTDSHLRPLLVTYFSDTALTST